MFPTVVNQFEYIADEKLIDAIINQDLVTRYNPMLAKQSVNNTLNKEKQFDVLTNKIIVYIILKQRNNLMKNLILIMEYF